MPSLAFLRARVAALPGLVRVAEALGVPAAEVTAAAPPGARHAVVAALAPRPSGAPVLAVTATGREAEDLHDALAASLGPDAVGLFPAWETLPHERLSPRSDTVGQRLSVLRRLAHPDADGDGGHGALDVVVAPVRSVLQPIARGLGELRPVALSAGDEAPLEQVVEDLAAAAYARTDLVERRGEFAVRGGILDVFPPTEEHPLRVEFWGDTVEEIRWFKVADQRSLEVAEHGLWAPPCRELLLDDAVRARAARLADVLPGARDLLEKLAHGIAVEGMESLAPALVDGMETLLEVLPPGSAVVVADPERVRTRAHDLVATSEEFLEAGWANAAGAGTVPIDLQTVLGTASFHTVAQLREQARALGLPWLDLTPFTGDAEDDVLDLGLAVSPTFRGRTEDAVEEVRRLVDEQWSVVVVTEGPGLARRVSEVLAEHEVAVRLRPGRRRAAAPGGHRHHRCASGPGSSCPTSGSPCSPRPTSPARQAAPAPPPRTCAGCRRGAATRSTRSSCGRATSSCTSSTASGASSRWCSAPCRAPPASTSSSSTRPPSAASPATASTCPPTSSTRSPATSGASSRR